MIAGIGLSASPGSHAKKVRCHFGEGHKRALAAGVKFGRKRKLSERAEAIKWPAAGEIWRRSQSLMAWTSR
jgi:hypothetical protein